MSESIHVEIAYGRFPSDRRVVVNGVDLSNAVRHLGVQVDFCENGAEVTLSLIPDHLDLDLPDAAAAFLADKNEVES